MEDPEFGLSPEAVARCVAWINDPANAESVARIYRESCRVIREHRSGPPEGGPKDGFPARRPRHLPA